MCSRHSVISGSPDEFRGRKTQCRESIIRDTDRIIGIRVRVYGRQEDVSLVDRQGADERSPRVIRVHYSR